MSKLLVVLPVLLILSSVHCYAWIYDAGDPQHGGPFLGGTSAAVWAAEPFKFTSDAYVTQFGAAMARGFGSTPGMGFNTYLTNTLVDAPGNALAEGLMAPRDTNLTYYYVQPQNPVFLHANTIYYLVLAINSNNFAGAISISPLAGYYGMGSTDYGATWTQRYYPLSIRLDGYFVPEPSSLVALLPGLLFYGLRFRKRIKNSLQ